ncbi:hypothetical protein Ddye_011250 [Dipteronia dyeriana]|uniref:Centromere protein C n=1 Tax=Dipteronia dyeriana TaxID=168575 RepID=A0AAD9UC38_9ROSI|nr:hypothetical protein Ddye_011250 [Dipteronia dyeriana]
MSILIQNSDPDDPLEGYSALTRTFASIPNATKPSDPDYLHHVHSFLKSMPLQIPDKLLEQAKAIVDSDSALPDSTIPSFLTSKAQNETVVAKIIENPQERRPALGRKRARFSLKPTSSEPTVSLEPTLDMDKLKDPEEFFLAFETLENAKRELQKQTGGISKDLNQQNLSIASRPRRPGLLRRSVKYKHHYSNDISSQETFSEDILGPIDCSVRETTNSDAASEQRESDDELQETKLADSLAKAENKVNEILDELLTVSCEELDGDGGITLLQQHLQIKPIDIENPCDPDWQGERRFDLKASGANLPKPRGVLSDIQNMLKGISSKTPKTLKQAERSVARLASPTPPKSPLDSIISLKKRIPQSNSSSDPFSALNIDQSPAGNASPFGSIKEQTAQGNMHMESSRSPKLKFQRTEENDSADMNMSVPEVAIGDVVSPNKTMDDNLSRLGSGIYVGSSGSNAYVDCNIGGSFTDIRVVNETSGIPDTDADVQTNALNELDDKMEDTLKEAVESVQPVLRTEDSNEPNELDDMMEDTLNEAVESVQPGLNTEYPNVENLNIQSQLDQANPAVVKEHAVDAPFKTADTDPEQHNEEAQISTKEPPNELNKATSPRKNRKRKELLNEQNKATSPRKNRKRKEPLNEQNKATFSCNNRKRKEVSRRQSPADQSNPVVVKEHAVDAPSETADTDPEQNNEKAQMSTKESMNEQNKATSPCKNIKRKEPLNERNKATLPRNKRKRKAVSRRQSLAGFGTSWESGTRRSTRIKSRPLEYWRGERFLYGRVNNSLATVIGIKYESPGKENGKPGLKVKSFVSDQYQDLIEQAARF